MLGIRQNARYQADDFQCKVGSERWLSRLKSKLEADEKELTVWRFPLLQLASLE